MNAKRNLNSVAEIRASTDSTSHILTGYAIVFNSPSEDMGFIETVDSHALNDVDLSNVFALYNHDFNNVLGKSGKNLTLKVDDKGLSFELELLGSDEHIYELVQQGIINKMSFGFVVEQDEWQDATHRTIIKLSQLSEVSLVPLPAYEGTDIVAVRSKEPMQDNEEKVEPVVSNTTDNKGQEDSTELQSEVDKLTAEVESLKKQLEADEDRDEETEDTEERSILNSKGNQETMTQAKVVDNKPAEVRNFEAYLENGEKRGLDTVSGAPIIPTELQEPQYQPQQSVGVLSLINTQTTDTNVGSLPIVKHATEGLQKAVEGQDVAEAGKPSVVSVDYHLNLYSGEVPLTYELAKSSKNASTIVLKHITAMRDLTRLSQVGALLQKGTPTSIKNIDDLKAQVNSDSLADYGDKAFIVTSDFYNFLDTQKTADGEYLLQPTLIEGAQKTLMGYPLYQVKNSVLGGGAKAFFGNAHDFALEVINENMIFSYQENRDLSQRAVGGVFADWQVADSEAGVFITVDTSKG